MSGLSDCVRVLQSRLVEGATLSFCPSDDEPFHLHLGDLALPLEYHRVGSELAEIIHKMCVYRSDTGGFDAVFDSVKFEEDLDKAIFYEVLLNLRDICTFFVTKKSFFVHTPQVGFVHPCCESTAAELIDWVQALD